MCARKHEQDPVRLVFLTALASLPPGRWETEHLTSLAQVVRDSLDAGGLSSGSTAAICRLVFALLPFHPEWSVGQLEEVTCERGSPGWTGPMLTVEEIRHIPPALTPIAEAWLDRENEDRVIALASTVGRRLPA